MDLQGVGIRIDENTVLISLEYITENLELYRNMYNFNGFINLDSNFKKYLGLDLEDGNIELELIELLMSKTHHRYWVICENNKFIGICYIYQIREDYNRCNLGLGLIRESRGKKNGVKVTEGLVEYLINNGFNRVAVEIEDDNKSSLGLIRKVKGFEYEGKLRNNYGKGVHSNVYSYIVK